MTEPQTCKPSHSPPAPIPTTTDRLGNVRKLLIAAGAVALGVAVTVLLIRKASQLAQGAGFAIAVEDETEEGYSFTQPAYPSAADGTRVVDPAALGDPLKYTRRPSGGRRLTDEAGLTLEDDD